MLVCELEPGGPTAAGGPADVVLTVEEPAGPSSFRVHGSAALGGFVFVVRPRAGSHPDVGRLPPARFPGGLAHPPTPLTLSLPRSPTSAPCTPCLAPRGVAPTSPCVAPTSRRGAAGG